MLCTSNCSCNLFCASIWHRSASAIGISLYAKENQFELRFVKVNVIKQMRNKAYPASWFTLKELELVPVECTLYCSYESPICMNNVMKLR